MSWRVHSRQARVFKREYCREWVEGGGGNCLNELHYSYMSVFQRVEWGAGGGRGDKPVFTCVGKTWAEERRVQPHTVVGAASTCSALIWNENICNNDNFHCCSKWANKESFGCEFGGSFNFKLNIQARRRMAYVKMALNNFTNLNQLKYTNKNNVIPPAASTDLLSITKSPELTCHLPLQFSVAIQCTL